MIVRIATAGSVDNGKSTLIGRLLFETDAIFLDQLGAVQKRSDKLNRDEIDFSLLTDGLESEQEQAITIDVAYRYFSTPKRHFIIADSPGHVEYTRNFITAASTANVLVILVDAPKGLVMQTKRHLFLASLLNIPHVLVAVNKMDLVDYKEEVFEQIQEDITEYVNKMNLRDLQFIPVSALKGDMVTERGENMKWYKGYPVLSYLENLHVGTDDNLIDFRFPVQLALRPHSDFRGYAGRVEGGTIRPGEEVVVLPSGLKSRVKAIHLFEDELESAVAGQSVMLTLEDDLDVSRGDMIVRPKNVPQICNEFESLIWWMNPKALDPNRTYNLKHSTKNTKVVVDELVYRINIEGLHREKCETLEMNDIGRIRLKTHSPIICDPFVQNSNTGNFILIDEFTKETVAGGIILQRSSHIEIPEDVQL